MLRILIAMLAAVSLMATAETAVPEMTDKNGYVEPFRMFDNLYYVGDKWVSSYVVETSAGLVIIDTLDFPYSRWIPLNLKKLGLAHKPVSHILVTHGHSDHAGGAAYLQSRYDAEVIMSQAGLQLAIEQANKSQGENTFVAPRVTAFAQDESSITIGDTRFKLYLTPGHTEGDMSIDFMVNDNGQQQRAFVVGGHGVNFKAAGLAEKFLSSMNRTRALALETPQVTVNLANHPHKNQLFEKRDKNALNKRGDNAFIGHLDFLNFIAEQQALARKKSPQSNAEAP